jgi:hypothetical protein
MAKPIIVYGSEMWAVTEMDMKQLSVWGRKILRRICGSVVQEGLWRTNQELREL